MSDDEEELVDLPDFANAANRALYADLKDAERALAATEEELAETGERVSVMEGHLGSVVAERQNTQRLVDAKAKEVETEDHLKQLADRELGRFSSELSKLQRECADLTDKATAAQTQIFKGNERMDAFKLQMNWKQEELEQWALAARQKEEDNLAMLKYAKADESRLKSLNLQLEKTLAQVAERQAELEAEVTKTSVQQVELDRTADDYRALQRERRELVEQWEMSVAAMQKRDEDISRAHEEYASAKRELEAQQDALAQKESELEARQKSNADLRHGIASAERAVGRRREEQRAAAEATESVQEQVAQARVAMSEAAAERDKRRAQIRGAEESLEERRAALEAAKAKLAAAEEAASRSSDNLGSLEAASRQMDELHAREGARLKERAKAAGALREALYAETARLQAARQAEARLAADIAGAERLLRNSRYRVGQLDEKAQRQREVLYTADFQLQLMQRKVARATGVRSAEEQTELKSQIATLQRQLEQQGATARMLSEQEKRLSNELKRARRREEEVTTEEARLRAAIDAVEVDNTLAQKQIKKEAQQRQEATVAADLLRLEVKKLREALHGRTDGVFGLENRKSQLQLSMAERQEEIKVHTDVLRAQLKAAEDERSRAKKALTERLLRVDRLSAKSANLEGKLGTDEDGAPQSQAYLVIKAAQERDELQRQGDELDAKIQTAEREVVSLDKALRHLVDKNAAYKAALAPAGPRTPLAEQRALLEEQHRAALARCRAHKVQQSEVEEEIGQMGVTLDELADVSGAQRQHYERLADASRSIGATLQERRGELQRVASELSSLLDAHRESAAASGVQGATALEREAALSERLVANRTTLERLAALSAEDASFGPALESLCAQAGVPPPDALPGDE